MPDVDTQKVIADVRNGMKDAEMMKKYNLSFQKLMDLFQQLVSEGGLSASEVQNRASVAETQQMEVRKCRSCGRIVFEESETCPECQGPLTKLGDESQ